MPDLGELFELFEQDLVRQNCSSHTIQAYAADLRRFRDHFRRPNGAEPAISEFDVMEFDVTKMRDWVAGLHDAGLGASTICRHIAALRAFFQFARKLGMIQVNPANMLRRPKLPQRLPQVMSVQQAAKIIDGVESVDLWNWQRDRAILELLYGCGFRVSELVGVDLADIDLEARSILIRGKGRRERCVPYGKEACKKALEEYLAARQAGEDEQALFVNKYGRRLSDRSARKIVKSYAACLGGDNSIHPHSFRHAYATHLLDNGANLRAIQKLLGHENLRATAKYTQVSTARMIEVYDKAHPASR